MNDGVEGILPVWKEKGLTSHDVVSRLRRIYNIKKVGHTGTLDPEVDGVLPVCIGRATKVAEYLTESDKAYEGEITIGYSTDTEDQTGEKLEQKDIEENDIDSAAVDEVLASFIGTSYQIPPMYSAVKVKGKKLYEYARNNEEVERPKREITIYSFDRISPLVYNEEVKTISFHFRVACSKGTYIRTLAVDVGRHLSYPAHMSQLTRIESGVFTQADSLSLSEIEEAVNNGEGGTILHPLEKGLEMFPKWELNEELWKRVNNGAKLSVDNFPENLSYPVAFYYKNRAIAIYDKHDTKPGLLKPSKMIRVML